MTLRKCFIVIMWLVSSVAVIRAQTLDSLFPISTGSIEGNINDAFYSTFYSFDVVTDDVVTITMSTTSGDLDPFMNLYNTAGEILLFNDDMEGEATRNSQIRFTADADVTYIVETTRFDREAGTTTGTYRLTLDIEGVSQVPITIDPLTLSPPFAVDFTQIEYNTFGNGTFDGQTDTQYFVFGGRQGDFVRVTTTASAGDLRPSVVIRNAESAVISTSQLTNNDITTLAAIPADGWYLIEISADSGSGAFSLFIARLAQAVLQSNQAVSGTLTETVSTLSYVFNGKINDTVLASVELLDFDNDDDVQPQISIINLNQEVIASFTSMSDRASVLTELPRSGAYIVQVSASGTQVGGEIEVNLLQSGFDVDKLNMRTIRYNESYKGIISNGIPLQYYRFFGKVGELVTVEMRADDTMMLDPYLILLDSELNELVSNDNVSNSANARLTQFTLPDNGEYYIIASRAGLENGVGDGRYTLSVTVGQIELQTGNFTATLNWSGDADLNLFVTEPSGRVISWSNPSSPNGGELQIDSNTNCETPTLQPVEHIFYPTTASLPAGDYQIWVWYQNVCSLDVIVPFTLSVTVYNQEILRVESTPEKPIQVSPNQRYEATVRVSQPATTIINSGEISSPSPQLAASQGGDTLIRYGETLTANIQNDIYARFYQFMGEAGDEVVITAETQTGNLDPILILRTADDVNLVQNDDISASNRNAQLRYTLEQSGQYIIAVTRYGLRDGFTTGSYNLTLERATE